MSDDFLSGFTTYKNFSPPGVRLPEIDIEDRYYKELSIDDKVSNSEFLAKLCEQGLASKGLDEVDSTPIYRERLAMELSVLSELGFIDYILLNWDIINFCHLNDIPTGPGRGSAAGSLVLYLINVTKVDPVLYDLFFERFVSKSRAKKTEKDGITYLDGSLLADIDNDISYDRRQEVIKYIEDKYPGRTAKILTLNTLSGKLCVKECGKIVGNLDESVVNQISDTIPKKFGKVAPLLDAIKESDEFSSWCAKNPDIFKISRKLEGLNKNTGVHPSG